MSDIDTERGVWAVVTDSGGKKYIGCSESTADDILRSMLEREPIKLTSAFALIEMDLPMQTPQGGVIQHIAHLRPADNCDGPATIHIVPMVIHLFTDMTDSDRRRHKALVEQIAQAAIVGRAEKAGIQLVGPGGMPRGPSHPPRQS